MVHWHVLQTKPNRERQVAVLVHQRGLEVYLPLIWGDPVNPRSTRDRPYFPRLLFARFDLQSIEPAILRWSPGLKGLLEFGREPATVSDNFINELQHRLSRIHTVGGMAFDGARSHDIVPIADGPFAGFEGIFSSNLSGPERARILLACIQREHCRLPQAQAPPAGCSQHQTGG